MMDQRARQRWTRPQVFPTSASRLCNRRHGFETSIVDSASILFWRPWAHLVWSRGQWCWKHGPKSFLLNFLLMGVGNPNSDHHRFCWGIQLYVPSGVPHHQVGNTKVVGPHVPFRVLCWTINKQLGWKRFIGYQPFPKTATCNDLR